MKDDYSDVVFSQGLVCRNNNNSTFCIVIDGHQGTEKDRASRVLEFIREGEFMIHTPPNRALRPTGKICDLKHLKEVLDMYVV